MSKPQAWVYFPPRAQGYQSLSFDLIPYTDVGGFFFTLQWHLVGSADGGYMGLQTQGSALIGNVKACNFSQWGTSDGRPGLLRPTVSAPFGGEGEGYQNHSAYPWVVGQRYRFELMIGETTNQLIGSINGECAGSFALPPGATAFGQAHILWIEDYIGGAQQTKALFKNVRAGYDFSKNRRKYIAPTLIDPDEAEMGSIATCVPKDGGYEMTYNI